MAPQTAQFDLSTASLDQPDTVAYGLVRGAGNKILQQELTDKSRVVFYRHGRGPWNSMVRCWINSILVALPSANIHFHRGDDGEIGFGMGAVSTGGDQHVDSFFSLIPGGLDPVTFSGACWTAMKVPADPKAPSADLTFLADFQATRVRQFDGGGNQTAFAWTNNWAWIICDYLIRKFILREGKTNQPLVAAELARFDFPSFVAAATYFDAVLSLGQPRFSDGGVVYVGTGNTADRSFEQMLLMCRSYLLERSGKFALYADQPRGSVFTFNSDNVKPGSFIARKSNLRGAANRLTATFRDTNIASGSADDATRFAISTLKVDHEAHQRSVGARGPGLSVLPKVTELALDLGDNTPERAWRLLSAMATRQLGDDVDGNVAYNAPFSAMWTGFEDSYAVEPGDVVTIDKSLSEEFAGKLMEVLEPEYLPDGEVNYSGLEFMPNAFPDVAPTQQSLQAPDPGTGLPTAGSPAGKNMLINPGFESNNVGTVLDVNLALNALASDDWFVAQLSPYHGAQVASNGRSGGRSGYIFLGTGLTIPSDSVSYVTQIQSMTKLYLAVGDIVRISAFVSGTRNAVPPAGVTVTYLVALNFFDVTGAFLGVTIAPGSDWTGVFKPLQAAIQVPATVGGGVPASCSCSIECFIVNSSGSAFATGASQYGAVQFDDARIVIQNTALDLTPLNTSAHATVAGGALSQSGVSGTILVASKTIQYGFGLVTYNAGSVSPGLGTWFVYADDPTYSGGAVTYIASATESDVYASDYRVFFGKITLSGGGGGVSPEPPGTGGGRKAL